MLGIGFMRTAGFMAIGMGPHLAASGLGQAIHYGLPQTLEERRKAGEAMIRIAGCYSGRMRSTDIEKLGRRLRD